MRIVSVSGATSRSGKTTLAATIIQAIRPAPVKALKFTTAENDGKGCPRRMPCTVCDMDAPFRIVTESEIILQPGTDTAKLAGSGAAEVIWCIARSEALGDAWDALRTRFAPHDTLVVEGSSILQVIRPMLRFFTIDAGLPTSRWKEASRELIRKAHFVCINMPRKRQPQSLSEGLIDEVRRIRGLDDALVIDVACRLSEWPVSEPASCLNEMMRLC